MKVVIGGADSNLSYYLKQEIKKSIIFENIDFIYLNKKELDITNINSIENKFKYLKPNFYINTSAYTNVDKAETNRNICYKINTIGPKNLSFVCKKFDTVLIHYSTDYVFDGLKKTKYKEDDDTNPISVYGFTKLSGDKEIIKNHKKHYILRISWLIDSYLDNFLTKIIKLLLTEKDLKVVDDQISIPTFYSNLANTTLNIISNDHTDSNYGIYNFTSIGEEVSRYQFTCFVSEYLIKKNYQVSKIKPISSNDIKNLAKRPLYSSLDCTKINKSLNINLIKWEKKIKSNIDNFLKNYRI